MKKINIFCFGFGKVAKYFIRNISKKYDVNLAATSREETQKKKIFEIKYACFKFINDDRTYLEREPLQNISKRKQLYAYKHHGFWQCMDTMRDKKLLEKIFKSKFRI